jgi:hypothetical protein
LFATPCLTSRRKYKPKMARGRFVCHPVPY